jgi:hypothetical protein
MMNSLPLQGDLPIGRSVRAGNPACDWARGWLLVFVWTLIRVPPWRPQFLFESDGVDPSWLALLNDAITRDWHFGTEILFTYGPLGFLHGRVFDPETYVTLMATWLCVACVLALTSWRNAGLLGLSPFMRSLGVVIAIEMLSRDVAALCFCLQAALFLSVVPIQCAERPAVHDVPQSRLSRPMDIIHRLLLILLVAALPWIKFSYLPSVAGLAVCLAIAAVMQRRLPIEAALLLLCSLVVWFGTGHTAADLSGYVRHGLELSRGYSAAMGTGPETLNGWIALMTAGVITMCLPWWFSMRAYNRRSDRWLAALFFSGLLFMIFKSSFVRWHPEKLVTFLTPVVMLLLIGLQCPRPVPVSMSGRCLKAITYVAVCLFGAAWLACAGPGPDRRLLDWVSGPIVMQVRSLLQSARDSEWLATTHQNQLELIRKANPIPLVDGSVDAFPSKLITPLAHGLDVQPRPVIQSYAAYTQGLLEINRDHLGGGAAPCHVLLSVSSIDNRLPTMDDAGAWLELLRRYQPAEERQGTYRLDRLSTPRDWKRELVDSQSIGWNDTWSIDTRHTNEQDSWLLCSIDCRPNAAGRLATTLYRLPSITLQITVGKEAGEFRLIPACAREGFLLNPLVTNSSDIPLLWSPWLCDGKGRANQSGVTARKPPQSLNLTTPLESCFHDRVDVKLWRLTPQRAAQDTLVSTIASRRATSRQATDEARHRR